MKSRIWLSLFSMVAVLLTVSVVQAATYGWNPPRYGNWGGLGYSNGSTGGNVWGSIAPVDQMDAKFRTHDRALATADAYYRPRYLAASSWLRPVIRIQWAAAYTSANASLAYSVGSLPQLVVNANGTDNWGGVNIPWSKVSRNQFRAGVSFIFVALPNP